VGVKANVKYRESLTKLIGSKSFASDGKDLASLYSRAILRIRRRVLVIYRKRR
jgi:hypothetical protein